MGHVCMDFIDREQLKAQLSVDNNDVYFVNVSDETWNEFKNEKSRRLELNADEIEELRQKASFLFLIRKKYVQNCMYYPKDD